MPNITCPECGQLTELLAVRRDAGEFCSHCDFPLFWAASSIPAMAPGANSDTTLRRLPGAGGRRRIGSKICPECGELNAMGLIHCTRCTAELDPKPVVAIPTPPPLPPLPPVVVVTPEPGTRWDYYVLGALLAAATIYAVAVSVF
jgi:hypothetical protein